ncbi:hypothetical protein ASG90_16365 [Nocardioides sp. Soil797]|nr:hypothetical protein ASG90_16365 [Nocardioides sp. Soil797]
MSAVPPAHTTPGPVLALHPFGDPQTVVITRDEARQDVVHLNWKVGANDDLTLLGISLGVLPEDRLMLDGAVSYEAEDAATVSDAEQVETYLRDHLKVSVGENPCTSKVTDVGDLVEDGAQVEFTCSESVDEATVTVTTLTDLHEAYRTLATAPGGQRGVYEKGSDTQTWDLGSFRTGTADQPMGVGSSAALQIGGVLGAVVLLAAGWSLVARRRRRRSTPSLTP